MSRLFLPLFADLVPERPGVDAARTRLGGRAQSEPGLGAVVRAPSEGERQITGVVLFVLGEDFHVVTPLGVVHRLRRGEVSFVDLASLQEGHRDVAALSADVQVFAALAEGQRVRYLDRGERLHQGLLVEKCRFGALVRRDDGVVMAVGFRKIWPDDRGSTS